MPTTMPTTHPTFAPLPPDIPVQPLEGTGSQVCEPEVRGRGSMLSPAALRVLKPDVRIPLISISPSTQLYLTRRRELAAAEGAAASPQGHLHEHRQLVAWTPDTCYYACRQRLNNPPTCVAPHDDYGFRTARRLDGPSAYSCPHMPPPPPHTPGS